MPRFDSMSAAALTPGGVTDGLSQLVSALIQGPIQARQQRDQEAQQTWQRGFQEKTLGSTISNQLADNQLAQSQFDESKRYHDIENTNSGLDRASHERIAAISSGKSQDQQDYADAAEELLGPNYQYQNVQTPVLDMFGRPTLDGNKAPVNTVKSVRREVSPDQIAAINQRVKDRRAARALQTQMGAPAQAPAAVPATPSNTQLPANAGTTGKAVKPKFTGKTASDAVKYLKQYGSPGVDYDKMPTADLEAALAQAQADAAH